MESLLFGMPYLQKQNEWRRGTAVRQFDYYYIQKKAFTAPIYLYNSRIAKNPGPDNSGKKIELLNEYNKIDFFFFFLSKVKGTRVCDGLADVPAGPVGAL